jgi:hypothetical protein
VKISPADGEIILTALVEQEKAKRKFPLDASDLRHLATPTVVRTERGEVEVEVEVHERDEAELELCNGPKNSVPVS